ncbi:MAG TPA: hypothetical protein VFB34_00070 [Chloroflexota bacterium]|nr:hypothetical protein [Chloroflexota bacterium]
MLIVDASRSDTEWPRIHELVERYLDVPLGVTDASIIALTERHRVTSVASLDRHLAVVRPVRTAPLSLMP